MIFPGGRKKDAIGHRMLHAEIDLGTLRENLERIRRLLGETGLLFVVKEDAYGHGLEEVVGATAGSVDWFGVGSLDEALRIRARGIGKPILIMTPPSPGELPRVIREGFHFVLGDWELMREAERAAAAVRRPAFVHIPVDTGMGRYGFLPEEVEGLLRELSGCLNVEAVGIYSHLSAAHRASAEDIAFTRSQVRMFRELLQRLGTRGIRFPFVHLANSAGLLSFPETSTAPFNLVRVGAAAYGYVEGFWREWGLRPVSRVWARVVAVRELPAGRSVGYERRYTTNRPIRAAIIGAGYRHGLSAHLKWAWIGEEKAPLIGRVGMDSAALDVSGIPGVRRGTEVLLSDGSGENIAGWILPALVPLLTHSHKNYVELPVSVQD